MDQPAACCPNCFVSRLGPFVFQAEQPSLVAGAGRRNRLGLQSFGFARSRVALWEVQHDIHVRGEPRRPVSPVERHRPCSAGGAISLWWPREGGCGCAGGDRGWPPGRALHDPSFRKGEAEGVGASNSSQVQSDTHALGTGLRNQQGIAGVSNGCAPKVSLACR